MPVQAVFGIAQQYLSSSGDKEQTTSEKSAPERENEFHLIHQAMADMCQQIDDYSDRERAYESLEQQKFWMDSINLNVPNDHECISRSQKLGIPCTDPVWCVELFDAAIS